MIHYFDNCATTQVDRDIMDVICRYNTIDYYNPSALGSKSAEVARAIADSRLKVAQCLGADKQNIIFTSGGTESNNIAILGSLSGKKSGNIVLTNCEHSSVLKTVCSLNCANYELRIANCDAEGHIDMSHYLSLIDDNTILACMMHVNNNTGAINDISSLCKQVKCINANTVVMSDGVQAVGKLSVNVKNLGIDLYTLSGHKLHTVKGIGALYCRHNTKLCPTIFGGGQENNLRSGTENVAGIVSLGIAVENSCNLIASNQLTYKRYRQIIIDAVSSIEGSHVNCTNNCLEGVVSIAFEHIKAEVLVHMLEQYGVLIGTSSACSSKNSATKNSAFTAMSLDKKYLDGILRISFSKYNTQEGVELLAQKLSECVTSLRKTMERK